MPASQAGRRRFDPGLPLQLFLGLQTSSSIWSPNGLQFTALADFLLACSPCRACFRLAIAYRHSGSRLANAQADPPPVFHLPLTVSSRSHGSGASPENSPTP